MVVYVDGKPHAQYNPDENNPSRNFDEMRMFIQNVTGGSKMKRAQMEMPQVSAKKPKVSDITDSRPKYSIGIPKQSSCVGGKCYLSFNDAYSKK